MPLGVLRFAFVGDDQAAVDRYIESARYQQRIAVSLRTRTETVVDDYMIAETPFAEELPWEKMMANLVVGDVETVSQRIIDAVARLPRVMQSINLPFQAGSDDVLDRMKRGYTNAGYRELVGRIRQSIPGVAMVTDLIVGFPGETEEQFEDSLAMVRDIRFDKVHSAAYSTRPNTFAQRKMVDDVPLEEKKRRLRAIEAAQEQVLTEINNTYFGTTQEVLVDRRKGGRWQGRTPTDKLVFFDPPPLDHASDTERDLMGELVHVRITKTTPWSLQGKLTGVAVTA